MIGRLADRPIPNRLLEGKPQRTPEEVKAGKLRRLRRIESDLARLQEEAEELREDTKGVEGDSESRRE